MKDIVYDEKQNNLFLIDDVSYKAYNLATTQVGSLYYAPTFGCDIERFFTKGVEIQTATFRAYLIKQLILNNINPIEINDFEQLFTYSMEIKVVEATNEQGV